jgi:hypothetical protein
VRAFQGVLKPHASSDQRLRRLRCEQPTSPPISRLSSDISSPWRCPVSLLFLVQRSVARSVQVQRPHTLSSRGLDLETVSNLLPHY